MSTQRRYVTTLTTEEAAVVMRLSPRTLENQRRVGGGPLYTKGTRGVRYRLVDLLRWEAGRLRASTFDDGSAASETAEILRFEDALFDTLIGVVVYPPLPFHSLPGQISGATAA